MPPKGQQTKSNKWRNRNQERRNSQSLVASSTTINRSTPTTSVAPLPRLASAPELKPGKKWCFEDSTPVYCAPDEPFPADRVYKGAVVGVTGQKLNISAGDIKTSWSEVAYQTPARDGTGLEWVIGWINDAYLDDYKENVSDFAVVVPHPTPELTDAQQYIIWENIPRHNLCGEFCVAFILNDDIDSVLAKWKERSQSSYNRILGGTRDETTGVDDLTNLLDAIRGEYGYPFAEDELIGLDRTLTYPVEPTRLLAELQKMLTTHYLITGVWIYRYGNGELVRKDSPDRIGHWVVLDRITRNGNRFVIYNSYLNRQEEYSFTEFYNSFDTNSGLWVKRKEARPPSPVEQLPKLEVKILNPGLPTDAAQYIKVEGRRKTKLCGEFCVAFILNESIEDVLQRWKEVQPILYAATVGANEGTGVGHLESIFRAYGYNTQGDLLNFTQGLTDPFLKRYLLSPGRIAKMLKTHYLILGVNINGRTGGLKRGNDVPHWVVINKLTLIGKNMGWVELYNPFQNRWEEYSYRELTNSIVDGYWSGVWVKRDVIPVYQPQDVITIAGTQPAKDGRALQWTERQLDDLIMKRSKSGKPPKKLAAELAELTGWKANKIFEKLKSIKNGQIVIWSGGQVREEIRKQLKNKTLKKISPERVADLSGWSPKSVKDVLNEMAVSEKWPDQRLQQVLREKLKATKNEKKVVKELVKKSGWLKNDILGQLEKIKEADKWPVERLSREIESRLENGRLKEKALAKLIGISGWESQEIKQVLKVVIASRKWTGPQLIEAIKVKLKTARSADKVVAEVTRLSGWNKSEIRKLVQSQKWTEEQIREEIEQQLNMGRPAKKISLELSIISGWSKTAIGRMLKEVKEVIKVTDVTKRKIFERERAVVVDPTTIIHASKPLAEFIKWQDSLLSVPGSRLCRVRWWGDDKMIPYGFDAANLYVANFQAVGLYNDGNKEFGAVTNFLRISHEEVMALRAMQIEDEYDQKVKNWRRQKMNWLCKREGTIYFFDHDNDQWHSAPRIRWGTLALGGNLVQVLETVTLHAKMRNGYNGPIRMARLKGFTESDWGRPLDELLTEGLVHRCFCVYPGNDYGDSPKGIVYSPFFSPRERSFAGGAQATSLYIPLQWLEIHNPEIR